MRLSLDCLSLSFWPNGTEVGSVKFQNQELVREMDVEVLLQYIPVGTSLVTWQGIGLDPITPSEGSPILAVSLTFPHRLKLLPKTDVRYIWGQQMVKQLQEGATAVHGALSNRSREPRPGEINGHVGNDYVFIYDLTIPTVQGPGIVEPAQIQHLLAVAEGTLGWIINQYKELFALDPEDELTLGDMTLKDN